MCRKTRDPGEMAHRPSQVFRWGASFNRANTLNGALIKYQRFIKHGIMPRGSKPGEHRGGRKKGAKNKSTIEKEIMAKMPLSSLTLTGHASRLAKDVLADCMGHMLMLAEKYHANEDKFVHYIRLAQAFASGLAPYQSPKLQTLRVSDTRDSPLLVPGETADEVVQTLRDMMRESGLIPTKLIEGMAIKTNRGHDA